MLVEEKSNTKQENKQITTSRKRACESGKLSKARRNDGLHGQVTISEWTARDLFSKE